MILTPELTVALQIGSGIFWTLVYLLIIRRGWLDKTFGMPVAALCANLSWEFIFGFLHPHNPPQVYVDRVWFAFDLVIVLQTIVYGRAAFGPGSIAKYFYPALSLTLALSFAAVLAITYEFQDFQGKYAAFSQNLMMSVLFVFMLLNRGDLKGQSLYIALFKMLGTLLPSILFHLRFPASPFLNFLYVATFIFDWIYIAQVYARCRALGIDPWRRF
jgi:hypothetical protein